MYASTMHVQEVEAQGGGGKISVQPTRHEDSCLVPVDWKRPNGNGRKKSDGEKNEK